MEYVWFLIGVAIGSIISNIIFFSRAASGTLKIDHTNPEKDRYKLVIDDLDLLDKKKKFILKIDNNADLSQE